MGSPGKAPIEKFADSHHELMELITASLQPKDVAALQQVSQTLKAHTDAAHQAHQLDDLKANAKHLTEQLHKAGEAVAEWIHSVEHRSYLWPRAWVEEKQEIAKKLGLALKDLEERLVHIKSNPSEDHRVKAIAAECAAAISRAQELWSKLDHDLDRLWKLSPDPEFLKEHGLHGLL